MASHGTNSQSLLLMLPRELRDEIYLLLALNQHVFTSSPKPRDRSLRRRHAVSEAHIDTRIYVPVLAPTNLLGACRQLREECLDIISRIVNSPSHTSSNYPQLAGEVESNGLATRENSQLEEISERAKDDGSVRITLELALPIRTNMGAYIPKRDSPSPCFMALLPLLSRARKIKFVVWGAYDWWKGPQQRYVRVERSERSLVKRTSSDQTDEVLSARKNASSVIPVPASSKPNPLSIAIDAIMKHLPLVEEVKVDVLMHAGDYWNWDLPDNRWEGIQGGLLLATQPPLLVGSLSTISSRLVRIWKKVLGIRSSILPRALEKYLRISKMPRKNLLSPRPTIVLNDRYHLHHSPCGPYHEFCSTYSQ